MPENEFLVKLTLWEFMKEVSGILHAVGRDPASGAKAVGRTARHEKRRPDPGAPAI